MPNPNETRIQKHIRHYKANLKHERKNVKWLLGLACGAILLCCLGTIWVMRSQGRDSLPDSWRPDQTFEPKDAVKAETP